MSHEILLGDWVPLPDGAGDVLAASGPLSASLSSTRAVVWKGDRVVASVVLEGGPAGIPRFVGERLFYGPGWIEGGRWTALPLPAPTVYGGVRTSAWSRDGRRVVLLVDGPWAPGDGPGTPAGEEPSSLLVERRLDGGDTVVAADPGAAAVWVSDAAIVGIGWELRVWDAVGQRTAGPAHEGAVVSVSASRDEAWLLTVGTDGTALLWDARSFVPPVRWPGTWRGAALSPDGEWAVAIDLGGALHAARRVDTTLEAGGALPATGVRTLVLEDARILASFDQPPFHRTAPLHVTRSARDGARS